MKFLLEKIPLSKNHILSTTTNNSFPIIEILHQKMLSLLSENPLSNNLSKLDSTMHEKP